MTPQWPIAFGDSDEAKKLLETALKINPNGIDSNYFYGDYLLSNNELHEAEKYFKKAISAKVRPTQKLADSKLIEEAKQALKATSERKLNNAKGLFASVFNTKEIK
jgi:Tfp pilus assembly protein PilF